MMRHLRAAVAGRGGYALAELLITTAVLGMAMSGVLGLLAVGEHTYLRGSNQVEAQQSARVALERLVRDIRGAGLDPLNSGFPAVTAQSPTGFTLQNDWNGSGTIEPGITVSVGGLPRGEQVTYSLAGQDLQRQESGVDAAPRVLASGIQQLTLQYLDAGGAVTATPASIRTVLVSLRVRQTRPSGPPVRDAQTLVVDRVRLRNRR